jgi:hypothetical protein
MTSTTTITKFQWNVWILVQDDTGPKYATFGAHFEDDEIEAAHAIRAGFAPERMACIAPTNTKPLLADLKPMFGSSNPLPDIIALIKYTHADLPDFIRGSIEAAFWTAEPNPSSGEYHLAQEIYETLSPIDRAHLIVAAQRTETIGLNIRRVNSSY